MAVIPPVNWWCHECGLVVLTCVELGEVKCNTCKGVFVERIDEEDDPRLFAQGLPRRDVASAAGVSVSNQPVNIRLMQPDQMFQNLFSNFIVPRARVGDSNSASSTSVVDNGANASQPNFHLILAMMTRMMQQHGSGQSPPVHFQFGNFRNLGDIMGANQGFQQQGDYVFGDMQALMNQLMQMDTSRSNPATKEALAMLDDMKLDKDEVLANFTSSCGVCQDEFKLDDIVNALPCCHYFHKACLSPWLQLRSTCPICRYNLNTGKIDEDPKRRT